VPGVGGGARFGREEAMVALRRMDEANHIM
jgi:hypothetical protein